MASLNKVTLIGYVGRDPETGTTNGGKTVANFSLATSERWTDREGNKQERTEWHRIQVFGSQADFVKKFVEKGSLVFVEGRIQTDKWEDKEGGRHETVKIDAASVQLLDRKTASAPSDAAA